MINASALRADRTFVPEHYFGLFKQIEFYADGLMISYKVLWLDECDCLADMKLVLGGDKREAEVKLAVKRLACADLYARFAGNHSVDGQLARIRVALYEKFLMTRFIVSEGGSESSNLYVSDLKARGIKKRNICTGEMNPRLFFLAGEVASWGMRMRTFSHLMMKVVRRG